MGLEPYLVASSVEAFIAQRLVRVICENCKEKETSHSPLTTIHYTGKGCEKCKHTGYKGRTAIYEILMLNEPIRELIMKKASSEEIKKKAVSLGMRTLKDDGLEKIKAGITTVDEVMRVTQISE
jgi:type II secretory ATPase GspE/PulE/Tfp pilus assembly ATPase PilB-like protein